MKKQALSIIFCLLIVACTHSDKLTVNTPQQLADGWQVSSASEQGFNELKLQELINDIPTNNPKLDGLVIARHGKLVAEDYFNGYRIDSLHKIWSITKAVSGTLVGIASDKGLLNKTDPISKYLGTYVADTSTLRGITIEHLITMTSGFEWEELGGPNSSGFQLPYSKNWIEFIVNLPRIDSPSTVYNYNTGNTLLLAPILKNATGIQAHEFAVDNLFAPLGINHYEWDTQSEFWTKTQSNELPGSKAPEPIHYDEPFASLTNTGSGLRMLPRGLCKLGQLYLNNGQWNDKQIISNTWVKASVKPHFNNSTYGYHWRIKSFNNTPCYYATGFGLQAIYVFPELDLVIVLTQQHYKTMEKGNIQTEKLVLGIIKSISSQ